MLTESQLKQFEADEIVVMDGFMDVNEIVELRSLIAECEAGGILNRAAVGRGVEKRIQLDERGDFIAWRNPAEATGAEAAYFHKIDKLITSLNRHFFFGIRDFEAHFTSYPSGTFYKPHVDRHRSGSHRLLSCVLYLNENWLPAHGGILKIWTRNNAVKEIEPVAGRLVLFSSELMHEVQMTNFKRMSITGWMLDEKRWI